MLFVTTQPDSDYYIWQVQVQLNNFKKFGCEDKCVIIFGYNSKLGINPRVRDIEKITRSIVLCYPDNRDLSMKLYSPSLRPHLLKQLFQKNPEVLVNKNYLYLDCDIIFTEYPNFSELNRERVVHISDTTSQISFDSIKEKDSYLFNQMCRSVGINEYVVDKNKATGGGIVFLFKKSHYFNYEFWEKVEKDSNTLYKMMLVSTENFRSVEMVTANKWSLLWNLWLIGYDTKISKELAVSWATNPIEDWNLHNLYNNAGVCEKDRFFLFYKTDFIEKCPFTSDLSYVSNKYCSYNYVQEIVGTGKELNLRN